jgi:hypothetical protein
MLVWLDSFELFAPTEPLQGMKDSSRDTKDASPRMKDGSPAMKDASPQMKGAAPGSARGRLRRLRGDVPRGDPAAS